MQQPSFEQKGAFIANSIIQVEDGVTQVPVLSNLELRARNTRLNLCPVITKYQRYDHDNNVLTDQTWQKFARPLKVTRHTKPRTPVGAVATIYRDQDDSTETDLTLSTRTNFPVKPPVLNEQLPKTKPFPTKPDVGHLAKELAPEQMVRLLEVLEEFNDLFMRSGGDLGCTSYIQHRIELEPGSQPFKEPLRKLNPQKRKVAEEQMEVMRQAGAIQPSYSPFASAVVLAPKSDGTLRFCIDFRRLNNLTVKDSFPLPRIDNSLEHLGAAKYFTSLDMGSAFWQIPMEKESIKYTAFATTGDLCEFKRMPFVLCNATVTFQRFYEQDTERSR